MSVRVTWDGFDAFRKALRDAPESVRAQADAVIRDTADVVARDVRSSYPQGQTGNLKRGVTVEHNSYRFGSVGVVRSRAQHASIFEHGTKTRATGTGANRGAMPRPPSVQQAIPKFVEARRRMTQALIDVLRGAGFEVHVDA